MRPPECEACGLEFVPDDGAAVRCLPTPASQAWRDRAESDGVVGHPPDVGWFCGEHAPAARRWAEAHTLSEVIAAVRRGHAAAEPPSGMDGLHARLRDMLPELAATVGLDPAGIKAASRRSWSPMDGVEPPWCPFVDYVTHEAGRDDLRLALEREVAHWSQDEPARTSLTLSLSGAGAGDFRVAAWSPAAGAPDAVDGGRWSGSVPGAVMALLPSAVRDS